MLFDLFTHSLMIEVTYQKLMFTSEQELTLSCQNLWYVIYPKSANLMVTYMKVEPNLFEITYLDYWHYSSSVVL